MISTVPIFLLLLFGFFAVGSLLLNALKLDFGLLNQATAVLTGTVFFALTGEWCAYLSLNTLMYVLIVLFLILVTFFVLYRRKQTKFWLDSFRIFGNRGNREIRFVGFPISFSVLYMILAQGSWSTGQIFYRTGPDTFGWSDAVNFFRDGLSLTQLKQIIIPSLNGTPLYNALSVVHRPGSTSIYQIPSFTRQIDAEFLLGAHRTGVNYFIGNIARLLPNSYTELFLIAFLMTSIFVISQVTFAVTKLFALPNSIAYLASFSAGLNCNLLFQSLEGGVGELFSIAYLVLVFGILFSQSTNFKNLSFVLGLLVIIAISSYFDILFTAVPIIGLMIIFQTFILHHYRLTDLVKNALFWVMCLLAFIPFATSFKRIAISPFLHPTAGGWDIGRHPLLTNLFGLVSNLPPHSGQRSTLTQLVEGLLSVGIVAYFLVKRKELARFSFTIVILMFAYLYYSVYHQNAPFNNYRLWKYAAIVSAIFPLLLVAKLGSASEGKTTRSSPKIRGKVGSKKLQARSHKFEIVATKIVLLAITVTAFLSMIDWQQSKKLSFNKAEANFIFQNSEKYDFVIGGAIYPAMVTMYGDIHFAVIHRGAPDKLTQYSKPLRPLLFITSNHCSKTSTNCLPSVVDYPGKVSIMDFVDFPDFTAVTTKLI